MGGSSTFPDYVQSIYPLQGVLDLHDGEGDKSSLGFMELLGMQDYLGSSSVFDIPQVPSTVQPAAAANRVVVRKTESSPEVLVNHPATPNSSSISSASSEALNDEPVKAAADNEEIEQQNNKKELKPKKTNHKRQREPSFAFVTKSEVDHLEDGYRWRKYGQKAVKNSPFPRSYYRCTTASCNVKKRIERSFTDPSMVVTTYEGQHNHPSPILARPSFAAGAASESGFSAAAFAMPLQMGLSSSFYQQNQRQPHSSSSLAFGFSSGSTSIATSLGGDRRFCNILGSASMDNGLLQDIVPSPMMKEE